MYMNNFESLPPIKISSYATRTKLTNPNDLIRLHESILLLLSVRRAYANSCTYD